MSHLTGKEVKPTDNSAVRDHLLSFFDNVSILAD